MEDFKPGKYRHYKGGEYELLFTATHSETLEKLVIYRALYGDRGIWARPAQMWNEKVDQGGQSVPRFEYAGD